jgi:hypothetical protein
MKTYGGSICIVPRNFYFYRLIFKERTLRLFDKRFCGPHSQSEEEKISVPASNRPYFTFRPVRNHVSIVSELLDFI